MSCDEIDPAALARAVGGSDEVARHCNYIGNIHLAHALDRPGGVNVPLTGELEDVPRDELARNRGWKALCNVVGDGMAADGKRMVDIKHRINAMWY